MRIHNNFPFLSIFIVMLLAFACTSDPKVATESLPSIEDEKIAEVIETVATPVAPSATEIAATEAAKVAEEEAAKEALKAEKKKEKYEAASKERRKKRREKRKKKAAEKAAAEKLALKEAAEAPTHTTAIDVSSPTIKSPAQEDLSGIDQELLDVIQVKSNGGTPQIRFDSESFDFGRVVQGKEIDHQFEFTNTGSAPLVINNVEVTCGCTTPFYPFIPIEPGERGKISVHFSSKGRLGNQSPTITVYTNTDPGTLELQLKGIVDTEREGQ